MAIKIKDESAKSFSIDGVCYTKGDYRLQYNSKKEILIIPKEVANSSNLSGMPFKSPIAWTYFVDGDENAFGSFEEFSLAISDAVNFNLGEVAPSYKVYTALLNQSGTNAPVATVLENTLGVTPTWTYDGDGFSILTTETPIFTENKVALFITADVDKNYTLNGQNYYSIFSSESIVLGEVVPVVCINTFYITDDNIKNFSSNMLDNTTVEIRVYN